MRSPRLYTADVTKRIPHDTQPLCEGDVDRDRHCGEDHAED